LAAARLLANFSFYYLSPWQTSRARLAAADAFCDLGDCCRCFRWFGGDEGIYVKWLNEKQISHLGEKLQFASFEYKKKKKKSFEFNFYDGVIANMINCTISIKN